MNDAAKRERAFVRYHVEGATVADVARELDTSKASVIRWARAFEKAEPLRAAQLRAGVASKDAASAPAVGFMAQLRARVEAAAPAPPVELEEVSSEAAEDDAPPTDDDDLSNESLLELVRGLIREARNTAATSDKREHVMRTIAGMLPVLDRLEKRMRDADDVLHVSKTEVDQAIHDITENFSAVCDQPFTCAECGRDVRRARAERAEAEGKGLNADDDE